jgi:two-component system sensor kinase FixL
MGEMAAGIAHEINQPLSAVSSYAQACKNILNKSNSCSFTAEFRQNKLSDTLEKISQQALRAGEVIRRLRAFVEKRHAKRELVDLDGLIEDTIELARVDTRLLEHGIRLHLNIGPKPQLMIDPIQIQQVLLNLIRNAIDAMEEQPTEAVHIHSRWLNQQFIEVMVSDPGHGVDVENQDSLFHPFFTTRTTGMGMGLAICQSIIHSHGGELRYSPGVATGTVFTFTLPVKPIVNTLLEFKIDD